MFKSFLIASLSFVSLFTLTTTHLLAMNDSEDDNRSKAVSCVTKAPEDLFRIPDEIILRIFSFLTQKDIPVVSRTCHSWNACMGDQKLWEGYALRACGSLSREVTDYKQLIKDLCTPAFKPLDTLNGGNVSWPTAVSADGSIIVGQAWDGAKVNESAAVRWVMGKPIESLGHLNGGQYSWATAVSANGSIIVGHATDGAINHKRLAVRWVTGNPIESLDVLNGKQSSANAVSADGSIIVGQAWDGAKVNESAAVRWVMGKPIESLGVLNEAIDDKAHAVNADGSIIVGVAAFQAVQWGVGKSIKILDSVNPEIHSHALGISADGSHVVGSVSCHVACGSIQWRPVRWVSGKTIDFLAPFGNESSKACAVSADGSRIIGLKGESDPFLWTEKQGVQLLNSLLTDMKLLPQGWKLSAVNAITPNGVVLVGSGGTDTQKFGWRAVLPKGNLF